MKKSVVFACSLLVSAQALADTNCFLAKEGTKVLKQEGDCQTRYAPASTFKIPLSLMGYDAGIFKSATSPTWPFPEGHEPFVSACYGPHDPRTWIRDSCVWYSQVLTQQLGMEKFKGYVNKLSYGNRDVSGDKGKNNGLTESWLSSSLEISPEEQVAFVQKLLELKLPVRAPAQELTKKILFQRELSGGWQLYGKTGNGQQLSPDKTKKLDLYHGWFVGWIEKNGRFVTFASHLVDDKPQDTIASFRARDAADHKLWALIQEFEKSDAHKVPISSP